MRALPLLARERCLGLLRTLTAGMGLTTVGLLPTFACAQESFSSFRATGAGAYGWQIHPSLSVSQVFSDNVLFAEKGFERAEWTTRVVPAIAVSGNSARLHFDANFAPELLARASQNSTDVFYSLGATGKAELLQRTFFVDLAASIFQQNVSLLGQQPDGNLNSTANRGTNRTFSVSPYLIREFGVDAIGELRLTRDVVQREKGAGGSSSVGFSDSSSSRIEANLTSGPAQKLWTWNIALRRSNIDFNQTGQKIREELLSAGVGRLITPTIRLAGSFGYEDSGYLSPTEQKLKGSFWSVGPEWTPSPRTRASATFGQRYFGPSRALHLEHRAKRAILEFDYNEAVSTVRNNLFVQTASPLAILIDSQLRDDPRFQDPIARQSEVRNQVAATPGANLTEPLNFLTDSLFLDKRVQVKFGIEGVKSTVTTVLYTSNRKPLSNNTAAGEDFFAAQTVKQNGVGVSWRFRHSEMLSSNLNLVANLNSFSGLNRTDRVAKLRWDLTKKFSPRVSGSFGLGRQQIDSSRSAVAVYQENSISVTLAARY